MPLCMGRYLALKDFNTVGEHSSRTNKYAKTLYGYRRAIPVWFLDYVLSSVL